jgi:deoxyribonucleoside regulator
MAEGVRTKRLEEIAHVAELHYRERLDQKEIAARIHASRSTVSRMLRDALDLGIVVVTIQHPFPRDTQLEKQLVERFGLTEAWVLGRDAVTTDDDKLAFGALGARCVEHQLAGQTGLAICWGRATRLVVESLRPVTGARVHLIQMIGSLGTSDSQNDGVELTRLAARLLGGTYQLLNAPLVVDDAQSARSLLRQSAIAKVLTAAENADCALVGLGTLDPASSAIHGAGYMTDDELRQARSLGAVGDVSGILIDSNGNRVTSGFSERVISLPLDRLHRIRHVIGVAYGEQKAAIIRAAALGGHIRVLVTDRAAAQRVLEESDIAPTPDKRGE